MMKTNAGKNELLFLGVEFSGRNESQEIIFSLDLPLKYDQFKHLKAIPTPSPPPVMKARKVSKQGYTPTYIRDQYKEISCLECE